MFELFCHHFLCELVPQIGKIGGVASDNSNVARVALDGLLQQWIGCLKKMIIQKVTLSPLRVNARSLTLAVLDPFKREELGGVSSGAGEDLKTGQL